ncbi:MAG TPA: hypothetical protein VMV26_06000 [Alphaproteobacteria bacterium]|nr:hypothetical protein [Alphaproteobacteria bacterium]
MDPLLLTILMRAIERLLIVAAGAGAIYLGYRLFLAMPNRDRSSGKLELPGGISIFLSRVGPGVFFSLFGAAVVAMALQFAPSYSEMSKSAGEAAAGGASGATLASAKRKAAYSGIGGDLGARDPASSETDRVNAANTVRNLNRTVPALAADVPATLKVDIQQAVQDAKLRVMRSVWSEPAWGPYPRFFDWVQGGETDPAPAEVREAVAVWRAGMPPAETARQ